MPMVWSERSRMGFGSRVGLLRYYLTYFSASLKLFGKTTYTLCLHIPTSHHIPKLLLLKSLVFPHVTQSTLLSFSLYTSQKHVLLLNTHSCIPSPHLSSITLYHQVFHFFSKNDSSLLCRFMFLPPADKGESSSKLSPMPSSCAIFSC